MMQHQTGVIMYFLNHYGLFLAETITLVLAVLFVLANIVSMTRKPKHHLEIISLNKEYDLIKNEVHKSITGKKPKKLKKDKKDAEKNKLFVIDFNGDIKASQVEQLRDEISAILTIATPKDEVLVRLESPGGAVNGYGLAASQLQRINDKHIPLTICIDKIAASGGYLMACLAQQIIAAPFAIIGSIGVVAQMPNFHRWLKKHDIDFELLTAGKYKRTLTLFAENTDKGREKFKQDLEQIHHVFRDYVLSHRQNINIDEVATGEHWLAKDALELRLVDKLQTSDDYILHQLPLKNIFKICIHAKPTLADKVLKPAMKLLHPWA